MLSHFQFEADVRKIKDQVVKIDILELNPTKYVQKLMEINQWDSNEIYVFDYGDNDSDMLDYFNHSYTPSNVSEKAKCNVFLTYEEVVLSAASFWDTKYKFNFYVILYKLGTTFIQ